MRTNAATAVCRALPFKVLMPIRNMLLPCGLYPFFSLVKFQPSGTAFAPAKSYTFKQ